MSPSEPLFLHALVPGALPYEIGDEIWQQSLAEAIETEAQTIADEAGADELEDGSEASRNQLRDLGAVADGATTRAAQLIVLTLERLDFFTLDGRRRVTQTFGLRLTERLAQHLGGQADIRRDMRDRTAGLQRQANAAVDQLGRVLSGTWHQRRIS